jgi:hypothetical protein
MADGGWGDSKTPLNVYAHAMRRDEGENTALRVLVEGSPIDSNGSGVDSTPTDHRMESSP